MKPTSRRQLLSTTLLASGGVLAAGPAVALSVEPLTGALEESYLSACGGDPNHRGFVDEVMALLEENGVAGDRETVEQVLSATTCPFCRCSLDRTAATATPRF